jgi:ubiquinone/menaquinone biosynthesis C-methylase UbiE
MDYYRVSRQASSRIGDHEGLQYLKNLCRTAGKILDVGCGEGTRLATLLPQSKKGWGIDPNPQAIAKAKKQYPGSLFRTGEGERLPYRTASFDLVYTAFAIEHCTDPKKFIREMIRVCRSGGTIVFLAPNYGAPNRRSPVSTENPYNKFFQGLVMDFFPYPDLNWQQVTPRKTYRRVDDDTTWEPYLKSLLAYLRKCKLKILNFSSLWTLEPHDLNFRKILIKEPGQFGVWPFMYWGPQLFVAARKGNAEDIS